MSFNHHFLTLKWWHPSNKANLTAKFKKEQEEKDRKIREAAAKVELEKRRERFLFDKMVEMRDNNKEIDDHQMDLDFMYAVPPEIKDMEKKEKNQVDDEDVKQFEEKYLKRKKVVTDIPENEENGGNEGNSEKQEKTEEDEIPTRVYEGMIKEEDGKVNYDKIDEVLNRFYENKLEAMQRTLDDSQLTTEDKHIKQFGNRAVEISKGIYLKSETPYGKNVPDELNTYIQSDEEGSDDEVVKYLRGLNETDRSLLLKKLEENANDSKHKHKHKHKHGHHHIDRVHRR